MGSVESSVHNKPIPYEKKTERLELNFPKSDFVKARRSSTISKSLQALKSVGTHLNSKKFDFISKDDLDRVCFVIVNTYKKQNFHLGVGPMNDAYIVASNHHRRGYKVFFLHNSTCDEFLTYLKFFIQYTQISLTVFYAGRTTSIQKEIKQNDSGSLEQKKNKLVKAMIFEQGYVIDNDIGILLANFKRNQAKFVFISDCCHGGPIWEFDSPNFCLLNLPDNIISISVENDEEISDYDKLLITNDGIFTIWFWRISNEYPSVTPCQLKEKIAPQLKKFGLSVVYHSTSNNLYKEPIFV